MFFLDLVGSAANPKVDPPEEVEDALRRGDDVEGGRDCAPVLEVGDPQLAAGKLPLNVGFLLLAKRLAKR